MGTETVRGGHGAVPSQVVYASSSTSKPGNNKLFHPTLGNLPKGNLQEINLTKMVNQVPQTGPAGIWTPEKARPFFGVVSDVTGAAQGQKDV